MDGGVGLHYAQQISSSRAAMPVDDGGKANLLGRGADDLERRSSLRRDQSRRPVITANGDLWRVSRTAKLDGEIRATLRCQDHPGMGHDRDQPAGGDSVSAKGVLRRGTYGLALEDRTNQTRRRDSVDRWRQRPALERRGSRRNRSPRALD